MNTAFNPIDVDSWARRDEFLFFSGSGTGFTITADADITALYRIAKSDGSIKLYPLLTAAAAKAVNSITQMRHGYADGSFGYYDVMHPLFFDVRSSGDVKCMFAEYSTDVFETVRNIARVRELCRDYDEYQPQRTHCIGGGAANDFAPPAGFPPNVVNISCLPTIDTTAISFSLVYAASYYPPIITFGKYRLAEADSDEARVICPVSVYFNHAVCDGSHAVKLIKTFESIAAETRR